MANTLFIRIAHSHVASSAGRFLDFCSGQLTHLLYSGIPYSSVIYLCAKYLLPYILLLLLGYLYIDDLGDGVDAKSSMGRPGRGAYFSPLGLAWPTFIITLL